MPWWERGKEKERKYVRLREEVHVKFAERRKTKSNVKSKRGKERVREVELIALFKQGSNKTEGKKLIARR